MQNSLVKHKRPSNQLSFILDSTRLQLGDIVLSTITEEINSRVIRFVTRGPFSHAAICLSPFELIEAVPNGLRRQSVLGFATHDPSLIRVLRVDWTKIGQTDEVVLEMTKKLGYFLEDALGLEYNTKGAFFSILGGIAKKSDGESYFCSEFVARAYEEIDLPLFKRKKSQNVTPNLLQESEILSDITEKALLRLDPGVNLGDLGIYVKEQGDNSPRLTDFENISKQNILRIMQSFCKRRNIDKPKSFEELQKVLVRLDKGNRMEDASDYDQMFIQCMQSQGLLSLPDRYRQVGRSSIARLSKTVSSAILGCEVQRRQELQNYLSQCRNAFEHTILERRSELTYRDKLASMLPYLSFQALKRICIEMYQMNFEAYRICDDLIRLLTIDG